VHEDTVIEDIATLAKIVNEVTEKAQEVGAGPPVTSNVKVNATPSPAALLGVIVYVLDANASVGLPAIKPLDAVNCNVLATLVNTALILDKSPLGPLLGITVFEVYVDIPTPKMYAVGEFWQLEIVVPVVVMNVLNVYEEEPEAQLYGVARTVSLTSNVLPLPFPF
jgi:hypothetical protein